MKKENLNKKKILTANQMLGELLISFLIYGILFFVLYKIAHYVLFKYFIDDYNYILSAIVIIILQAFLLWGMFKFGNKRAFKKGTFYKSDVPIIINNISFIIIVILLILGLSIFANVESTINEIIENRFSLRYSEKLLSQIYNEEEMHEYKTKKDASIKELKNQIYQYLSIVEIGICTVYLSAIFIEKKSLYNNAI